MVQICEIIRLMVLNITSNLAIIQVNITSTNYIYFEVHIRVADIKYHYYALTLNNNLLMISSLSIILSSTLSKCKSARRAWFVWKKNF